MIEFLWKGPEVYMSAFVFGANCDGKDVFINSVNNKCIGIGWNYKDKTSGHNIIRSMKVGDIVYIKNCKMSSDITVRAIGIITDFDYKNTWWCGGCKKCKMN